MKFPEARIEKTKPDTSSEVKMTLPMTPDTIISDLQRRFQEQYNYLNLKFFRVHSRGEGFSTVKKACLPASSIGKEFLLKQTGEIHINDNMTVHELISEFYDIFGIHAQVFRKSANLWMEITLTNNWTLQQQNNHGKEISIQ